MPTYRYVSQGEYYITSNPEVIPVTSGMTECVAVSFIDKENPKNRLLVHLDGMNLESKATAKANLERMMQDFRKETDCKEIAIYALGGKRELQNLQNFTGAISEMKLEAKTVDAREFCHSLNEKLKAANPRAYLMNPTNAEITMICPPKEEPEFRSFSSKLFTPATSLKKLQKGDGLTDVDKIKYDKFNKANDFVLTHLPNVAKQVRSHTDTEFVEQYSSQIECDSKSQLRLRHL